MALWSLSTATAESCVVRDLRFAQCEPPAELRAGDAPAGSSDRIERHIHLQDTTVFEQT